MNNYNKNPKDNFWDEDKLEIAKPHQTKQNVPPQASALDKKDDSDNFEI